MPAVEPVLLLVEVHGSPLSIGASGAATHELGEGLDEGTAAGEEDAVVPVGGDDAVSPGDG